MVAVGPKALGQKPSRPNPSRSPNLSNPRQSPRLPGVFVPRCSSNILASMGHNLRGIERPLSPHGNYTGAPPLATLAPVSGHHGADRAPPAPLAHLPPPVYASSILSGDVCRACPPRIPPCGFRNTMYQCGSLPPPARLPSPPPLPPILRKKNIETRET